jgi:hypothetical protein
MLQLPCNSYMRWCIWPGIANMCREFDLTKTSKSKFSGVCPGGRDVKVSIWFAHNDERSLIKTLPIRVRILSFLFWHKSYFSINILILLNLLNQYFKFHASCTKGYKRYRAHHKFQKACNMYALRTYFYTIFFFFLLYLFSFPTDKAFYTPMTTDNVVQAKVL